MSDKLTDQLTMWLWHIEMRWPSDKATEIADKSLEAKSTYVSCKENTLALTWCEVSTLSGCVYKSSHGQMFGDPG